MEAKFNPQVKSNHSSPNPKKKHTHRITSLFGSKTEQMLRATQERKGSITSFLEKGHSSERKSPVLHLSLSTSQHSPTIHRSASSPDTASTKLLNSFEILYDFLVAKHLDEVKQSPRKSLTPRLRKSSEKSESTFTGLEFVLKTILKSLFDHKDLLSKKEATKLFEIFKLTNKNGWIKKAFKAEPPLLQLAYEMELKLEPLLPLTPDRFAVINGTNSIEALLTQVHNNRFSSSELKKQAELFAADIIKIDSALLKNIRPRELTTEKTTEAPNLTLTLHYFETLSNWITWTILKNPMKERAHPERHHQRLIAFFIEIMKICIDTKSFQPGMCIHTAIESSLIGGLKKASKGLEKRHLSIKKEAEKLFTPTSNFNALRSRQSFQIDFDPLSANFSETQSLPFISVFKKDILFITETNELKDLPTSTGSNKTTQDFLKMQTLINTDGQLHFNFFDNFKSFFESQGATYPSLPTSLPEILAPELSSSEVQIKFRQLLAQIQTK